MPAASIRSRHQRPALEPLENRLLFIVATDGLSLGALDPGFGGGKGFTFDNGLGNLGQDIITLPNGKIIVAGRSANDEFLLFRNKANGDLDPDFGTDQANSATVTGFAGRITQSRRAFLLANNKIMVVGESFNPNGVGNDDDEIVFARYDLNGNPDTAFGINGVQTSPVGGASFGAVRDVIMQKDGKFIAVGRDGEQFTILRYLANGKTDTAFGTQGRTRVGFFTGSNAFADAVAVQRDGKIVVGGVARLDDAGGGGVFALARLTANGKLDKTFGNAGKLTKSDGHADVITALLAQSDGKIVAAGGFGDTILDNTQFVILRFNATGVLDQTFGNKGHFTADLGGTSIATQLSIDQDGSLLFSGVFDHTLAIVGKLKKNGSGLDPSFDVFAPNPVDTGGGGGGFPFPFIAHGIRPLALMARPGTQTAEPLAPSDAFLDFLNNSRARIVAEKGKILVLATSINGTKLARVFNDGLKPQSALITVPQIVAARASIKFTVKFTDNIGVDVHTLDSHDLVVSGPGFQVPAAVVFVSVDRQSNGTPRVATYKVPGPHGRWTGAADGTYLIKMQTQQVSDVNGNFVPKRPIKSFKVQIPSASTRTPKNALVAQSIPNSSIEKPGAPQSSVAAALFSTNAIVAPPGDDDKNRPTFI